MARHIKLQRVFMADPNNQSQARLRCAAVLSDMCLSLELAWIRRYDGSSVEKHRCVVQSENCQMCIAFCLSGVSHIVGVCARVGVGGCVF